MIAVVDAGLGNLRSVEKALAHVGADVRVTADPEDLARAERIVVPGQGAFGDCGRALAREAPLGRAILAAIAQGKPYLGICLGLQVLFDESDEAPGCRGLGVFPGRVARIPAAPGRKVPHMGWNSVEGAGGWELRAGGETYYFVHSYHALPGDRSIVVGGVEYGGLELVAAIGRDNVFAVQFHPEKSQRAGLDLLARFLAWRPRARSPEPTAPR